ncbi:restriction endonuclease [Halorussus ruber]|uniref:restriction endonuclease n=1 Tax=Halorussus ruber TaxID=1126238 RepID=UPI001091AD30|nr:restriction endonuclease [Halorussus ruber]
MPILDELSGHEFEDVMEDVFRNLGYQNVRQSKKTGDEGRDILMEEFIDGRKRGVVVECKHQQKIGRPVVQKLHSAVATYDYDGPKRGIIVTTGRFTDQAIEYADKLRRNGNEHTVELMDGTDLREIADEVGLDLYNGRIEILCERTLRPIDPSSSLDAPVEEAFQSIQNFDTRNLPELDSSVTFKPVVSIQASVNAVFETTVGVINRVHENDHFVVRAERGRSSLLDSSIANLISNGQRHTVKIENPRIQQSFDDVSVERFGKTETEYKDWAVRRLQSRYTETVEYTGDNNVTYTKECEPNLSDISVESISPVYLPRIESEVTLQNYSYSLEYYAAGPSRETIENDINECVHCGRNSWTEHTYCDNCGSINCRRHVKTERVEGEPVCTGCAITERFAFRKKYFYDEENLEEFSAEYDEMGLHQKALENKPLLATAILLVVVGAFLLI